MASAKPASNAIGHSNRGCSRTSPNAKNAHAPPIAKAGKCPTALVKNTPLSAAASAPSKQAGTGQFHWRRQNHAAMPNRKRQTGAYRLAKTWAGLSLSLHKANTAALEPGGITGMGSPKPTFESQSGVPRGNSSPTRRVWSDEKPGKKRAANTANSTAAAANAGSVPG
jgi:hypothetical protein